MAKGPGYRPLILLRWILLGLLLVALAAVLRIYLDRDTAPTVPRLVPDDPQSPVESSDVVLAAEGFEYEVIDEGETLFFISSNRMVSDRENRFVLEGVELRMEEDRGKLYTIVSDRAVYDLESRNARLEGGVVLSGPDGIELRGEEFDLQRSGRVLESVASPVTYLLPDGYGGRASGVRINLNRGTLLLRGGATIASPPGAEPPVRLTAQRMLYNDEEGLLRATGGAAFEHGANRLSSVRLSVSFNSPEAGGGVSFLQSRWQVSGSMALDATPGQEGRLEFEAETMGVAFDSTGKRVERVVLEGGDGPATVRLYDGAGLRQRLWSGSIVTGFADGEVSRLETLGPAVLDEALELPGAAPLRQLCGDRLTARIGRDGGLGELDLEGSVDYRDGRMSAAGDRLQGDPQEELRLSGAPARLLADTDDVAAPKIVYSRRDGSLVATGGVRAAGLDRSGVELAAADDRAPVLVTADRASWREDPPEVAFVGTVRAWQGESFLLADRLRSLGDGERLIGEGAVRTVWRPAPDDPEGRPPIEVSAESFAYQRQERRLTYAGKVRAHEAGRTLRCEELELLMDAERQIESLFCQGKTVVEDPVNGRTVRGSEALYTPADRLVLISGAPVVLEQRDGTEIEGRKLRYDLDSGAVQVLSEPRVTDPETETPPAEPTDG